MKIKEMQARALAYLERDDLQGAAASLGSDLKKSDDIKIREVYEDVFIALMFLAKSGSKQKLKTAIVEIEYVIEKACEIKNNKDKGKSLLEIASEQKWAERTTPELLTLAEAIHSYLLYRSLLERQEEVRKQEKAQEN